MERIELWVPIIGSGTEEDPYRPDLPDDVSWEAEIPCELDPASPRHGQPLNKHTLVTVYEAERPRVGTDVPAETVPVEERLIVELCRAMSDRSDLSDRARAVMAREAHRAKTPEGCEMLKRLLIQMVRRGLAAETAQAIAREHGL